MKKILLVSLLMITIILVGCQSATEKIAEEVAEAQIKEESGEDVQPQSQHREEPSVTVEETKSGEFVILPNSAKYGEVEKTGVQVSANVDLKENCLDALLEEGDEKYCYVSEKKPAGLTTDELLADISVGINEVYFEIPDNIGNQYLDNAKVEIEIVCSSGLGLYFLTEFEEWARFGEDLPSEGYKPDGSYGYLGCRYGAKERKSISLPIEVYKRKAGVRIIQEEATAYALVDSAKLILSK